MTITLGWIRRNKATTELILASDSRLRSRGPLDQSQKLFPLDRGDCCLGFSGDAQIAYPLFMQVGAALNNYIRTRTRAADVTKVGSNIEQLLNNLIGSWNLPEKDKREELKNTNVMFAGWSWQSARFNIGVFRYENDAFNFHRELSRLPHPWAESERSLIFIGNYEKEYMAELARVLEARHGKKPLHEKARINFDYEPIEALHAFLQRSANDPEFPSIGGAPQAVKVYSYGNTLPIVMRTTDNDHFLLGRRLFEWEKLNIQFLISPRKSRFSFILWPRFRCRRVVKRQATKFK